MVRRSKQGEADNVSPRLGHDLIARPRFAAPRDKKTPEVTRLDSGRRRIMLTVAMFAMALSIF